MLADEFTRLLWNLLTVPTVVDKLPALQDSQIQYQSALWHLHNHTYTHRHTLSKTLSERDRTSFPLLCVAPRSKPIHDKLVLPQKSAQYPQNSTMLQRHCTIGICLGALMESSTGRIADNVVGSENRCAISPRYLTAISILLLCTSAPI